MNYTVTCVYCGQGYEGDETWGAKHLTDHIKVCHAHPMKKVIEQRDRMRAALVGMVDETDPRALVEMRGICVASAFGSAKDAAAMCAAIDALLEPLA